MTRARPKNVLLVNPPPTTPIGVLAAELVKLPPMGLAFLAGAIRRHGYTPSILDMRLRCNGRDRFEEMLRQLRPKVVGITVMTDYVSNALRLARVVKSADRDCAVVFGGPHPGFRAAEILNTGLVDIIAARGDGEELFVEVCDAVWSGERNLDGIRGIVFKSRGSIVETATRPLVQNLDSLPGPAWDLLRLEDYSAALVHSTRGCIGHCKFCCEGRGVANRVRLRSVSKVMEEVTYLYDQGVRFLGFSDDNFISGRTRLEELCSALGTSCPDLSWTCETRVDTMPAECIRRMADAGCIGIHYGIESVSTETQEHLRKVVELEQFKERLAVMREARVGCYLTFVVGLPNETEAEVRRSFAFATEMAEGYEAHFAFPILTPYPGSEYGECPGKYGIVIHSRNYDDYNTLTPVISTSHLTQRQIKTLQTDLIVEQMNSTKGITRLPSLVEQGLVDPLGRLTIEDDAFSFSRRYADGIRGGPARVRGD